MATLPSDLLADIMKSADLLPTSLKVSRAIRTHNWKYYWDHRSPSTHEMEEYFDSTPSIISYYYTHMWNGIGVSTVSIYLRPNNGTYEVIRLQTSYNEDGRINYYSSGPGYQLINRIVRDELRMFQLFGLSTDLSTLKEILGRREDCIRRDPNYIKGVLGQYFQEFLKESQSDSLFNLFALHQRLVPLVLKYKIISYEDFALQATVLQNMEDAGRKRVVREDIRNWLPVIKEKLEIE